MDEQILCPECGQDCGVSTVRQADNFLKVYTFCRHCEWEKVEVKVEED
jgi:C4-type Zn-finger protein